MEAAGKTKREIAEHFGLSDQYVVKQLLTRKRRKEKKRRPEDLPFEEGGGFKVCFDDGGLFQYHPADKRHHGGAYYEISTGKRGAKTI